MVQSKKPFLMITGILSLVFLIAIFFLFGTVQDDVKKLPELKEDTIKDIKLDMKNIPNFAGVMVIAADIKSNTRYILYRYESDPALKEMFDNYFRYRSVSDGEPLFVRDNDALNLRIVRLINHEFDCSPYSATIASRFVPESGSRVTTVCSVGIPPSYGGFDGMITVFLHNEPTEAEKDQIKVVLRDIANDVAPEIKKNKKGA